MKLFCKLDSSLWFATKHFRYLIALRLFCVSYVGGNAGVFHNWPRSFSQPMEICSIQLPERVTPQLRLQHSLLPPHRVMAWCSAPSRIADHKLLSQLSDLELMAELRRLKEKSDERMENKKFKQIFCQCFEQIFLCMQKLMP